jgi:hypothetical protein
MEPIAAPAVTASKAQLQSTASFDVEQPYKAGDLIQIWSTSQQRWCPATVEKAQGEWCTVSYKGAEGRLMSKVMPNGHAHLQHAWSQNNAPPEDPSLSNSPQKGLLSPGARGQQSPLSPGGAQSSSLLAGFSPLAPAAVATYKVGDELEIWSSSQNSWCRGKVFKAEGEWVHVAYKGPGGEPMTKLMPNGHEELRLVEAPFAQDPYSQVCQPGLTDFLSPTASKSNLGLLDNFDLPPPPPPASACYQQGDRIEIWSASQNSWRPGHISKVDGEWVHVAYQGPGGQPMSKIMPNGHAQLRQQAAFAQT